jgi:coiled-coil and C2 domain-containing protein 2A
LSSYPGFEKTELRSMIDKWLANLRTKVKGKRGFTAFGENLYG